MTQDSRDAAVPLDTPPAKARRKELLAFLILAFGIWPIVAVGVVALGIAVFHEPVTLVRLGCIALIVAGVVGLRLAGSG